jgi:hypothetical protein
MSENEGRMGREEGGVLAGREGSKICKYSHFQGTMLSKRLRKATNTLTGHICKEQKQNLAQVCLPSKVKFTPLSSQFKKQNQTIQTVAPEI